jgi:6-phosphogluconolactonase
VLTPDIVVHADADILAKAIAARLITRLVDAQAARGSASVVLTGGGLGTNTLAEVRQCPARDAVDWSRVDVWWGDERFVPAQDAERNDLGAREALLDAVPLDPARVHAYPASDDAHGYDLEAAAAAYAGELAAAARPEDTGTGAGPAGAGQAGARHVPRFDVLLLGVGEEGHVASIFPDSPAARDDRAVVAVTGCPKPPSNRLSLTFPAIAAAEEVWLCTAGAGKAEAVAKALTGAGQQEVPAAGARGRSRTLWLLDRAAASELPAAVLGPRG